MGDITEVLERLVTDHAFRQQLRADPAAALEGYDLDHAELAMLAAGVTEGVGDSGRVERRTSKSALSAFLGDMAGDGEEASSGQEFDGQYYVKGATHHTADEPTAGLIGHEPTHTVQQPIEGGDPNLSPGADIGSSEAHLPEPEDEVLVAFESDDPATPSDDVRGPSSSTDISGDDPDPPPNVGRNWTDHNDHDPGQSAGLRSDGELVQDDDDDLPRLTSEQHTDEAKPGDVVIKGKKILLNTPDRDPSEDIAGQGPSGDPGLLGQWSETDLDFVSGLATDGGATQEPPTEEIGFVYDPITFTDDEAGDLASVEHGEPGASGVGSTLFSADGTPIRAAGDGADGAEPSDIGPQPEDEGAALVGKSETESIAGNRTEGGQNEFVHKPPGKAAASDADDSLSNLDRAPSDDGMNLRQFQEVSGAEGGPDIAAGGPDQASP